MTSIFLVFLILVGLRIVAHLFGSLIGLILGTLFKFTYGARVLINDKLLCGDEDKGITFSEYRVFWLGADLILLHPILIQILDLDKIFRRSEVVALIILGLLVFSLVWLKRRSLRPNVLLSYILMILSLPFVVASQIASIALNVLLLLSTSPRYQGKVHYAPIKPL